MQYLIRVTFRYKIMYSGLIGLFCWQGFKTSDYIRSCCYTWITLVITFFFHLNWRPHSDCLKYMVRLVGGPLFWPRFLINTVMWGKGASPGPRCYLSNGSDPRCGRALERVRRLQREPPHQHRNEAFKHRGQNFPQRPALCRDHRSTVF